MYYKLTGWHIKRTTIYYPGRLWNNGTESESGKLVASCQKPVPMIPAHQLASRPGVFGQTLTRPSRWDPGQFCAIWSMPSLEKRNQNECGKSNPAYMIRANSGRTLVVMAIIDHNQNASGSNPVKIYINPRKAVTNKPPRKAVCRKFGNFMPTCFTLILSVIYRYIESWWGDTLATVWLVTRYSNT